MRNDFWTASSVSLTFLRPDTLDFPPSSLAAEEPNGLLAVGGDLSSARLLEAYRQGIFPWYEEGQPILWWSPSPRTVLYPERIHCSSSMRKWMRRCPWQVAIDRNFAAVINHCSGPRAKADGTWITSSMKHAYCTLHELGFAHSVEIYEGESLVGGIYGIALGSIFYGESMFSVKTNASKLALIVLARFLKANGFYLIDCQVASKHLFTLGAEDITRPQFEAILDAKVTPQTVKQHQQTWQQAANKVISHDGHILN